MVGLALAHCIHICGMHGHAVVNCIKMICNM